MIVLASSSKFRAELLTKLNLEFVIIPPQIDETRLKEETPYELVYRLAQQKAEKIAQTTTGIIIASDQVAVINGEILSKPYTKENAIQQLKKSSGNRVDFLTSLCVLGKMPETIVENFSVYFRTLTDTQIENYLTKEEPFDCVGSFKVEGLGIALFEKLIGEDPNTLIGLPLIKLIKILENNSIRVI